jgi:hypothetical protein
MSEPYWAALGGGSVDYKGAWAAGTAYAPGDVVRSGGVDYLAVNPSTGVNPGVATGLTVPGAVGVLDLISTDVTVGGVTTETSLGSVMIPALSAKGGLRITLLGHGYTNVPGGDKNYTLRVKLGGTTIFSPLIAIGGDFADARATKLDILILNQNALNEQFIAMEGRTLNNADIYGHALAAVDTSVARLLELTFQWTIATATRTHTFTSVLVEKLG